MINVIASIKVKRSQLEAFIEIFKQNIANVLDEDGCIEYAATIDIKTDISIQISDKSMVTIIEKWQSVAALEAHLAAPHMLAYQTKVKQMVESVSLKILQNA